MSERVIKPTSPVKPTKKSIDIEALADKKPEPTVKPKVDTVEIMDKQISSGRNQKRGMALAALGVFVIVAFAVTSIVNNITSPDSATIVKSSPARLASINVTEQGFRPATLIVKKGTVVIWHGSESGQTVIIASNPYPTDDSVKSLKSTQLAAGANYRYKFNDAGTFQYHDDLNPSQNGIIIVR